MGRPLFVLALLTFFMMGYWIPEDRHVPVDGAQAYDWNPESFWYGGRNYVHKGIDIFAARGTPVKATTGGWVLFGGKREKSGNAVLILSAKWRLHYYAHLDDVDVKPFTWVKTGSKIGTVGDTGNAQGRPTHLYYSIRSLPPQVDQWEPEEPFSLEKTFYVNPHEFLTEYQNSP